MNVSNNSNVFSIVAFGDSTTAPRDALKIYSQVLQDNLRIKSGNIQVINAGVGGNTTADARKRFETDVLSHSPNLVIIGLGINDSAVDVYEESPKSQPRVARAEYENNLRRFVRALKSQQSQVILMTPNTLRWTPELKKLYGKPPYNPDDPDGFNILLRDYAESVRRIAREESVQLADVFAAFIQFGAQPGQSIDDLLLDGMHPNERGQRIVADLLIKAIIAMNPAINLKPAAR
ncbi:MAG: SGNH/GDSL hydrolase family protein [Kiritimatiellia bacterium]|nr:SGNH/GDSL hydrolase family protein [Kiritimatiellia bacterium]